MSWPLILTIYFRLYYTAPGMINDCVFYTSIVAFVVGLLNKKNWLIAIAVTISVFSRQTSILLIPILFLFSFYKHISFKLSIVLSLQLAFLYLSNIYFTEKLFGVSQNDYFMSHAFCLLFWIYENLTFQNGIAFLVVTYYL